MRLRVRPVATPDLIGPNTNGFNRDWMKLGAQAKTFDATSNLLVTSAFFVVAEAALAHYNYGCR
jgi:hypothetical protein